MEKRRRLRATRSVENSTNENCTCDYEIASNINNSTKIQAMDDSNQGRRRRRSRIKDDCEIQVSCDPISACTGEVLVVYPEGHFEYVPIVAQYLNSSRRYLVCSGDQTFHTHFDCYLKHHQTDREFKGWVAIKRNDVEKNLYSKCPWCEEIDKQFRKEYLSLSYREQVDREWGYYNTEKPLITFSVTIHNEMYIEEMHRKGEEISVEKGTNGKAMICFGLTEYCSVPKRIIEFCGNNFDDYKMFILAGNEDENFNLKLCIGVYKRKLWYYKDTEQ